MTLVTFPYLPNEEEPIQLERKLQMSTHVSDWLKEQRYTSSRRVTFGVDLLTFVQVEESLQFTCEYFDVYDDRGTLEQVIADQANNTYLVPFPFEPLVSVDDTSQTVNISGLNRDVTSLTFFSDKLFGVSHQDYRVYEVLDVVSSPLRTFDPLHADFNLIVLASTSSGILPAQSQSFYFMVECVLEGATVQDSTDQLGVWQLSWRSA